MSTTSNTCTPRSTTPRLPGRAADDPDLDALLARAEWTRQEQLESLRDTSTDLVAIAHREAVSRILTEIRLARSRLREGRHGECVRCRGRIPADRIEALPWATQCLDCARRRYQ